jgi:hypothetical protein
VEARHEDKGCPGQVTHPLKSSLYDLGGLRPGAQILDQAAGQLAGMAADAFFLVLEQIVLAHIRLSYTLRIWLKDLVRG